jgi:hypothetical protein
VHTQSTRTRKAHATSNLRMTGAARTLSHDAQRTTQHASTHPRIHASTHPRIHASKHEHVNTHATHARTRTRRLASLDSTDVPRLSCRFNKNNWRKLPDVVLVTIFGWSQRRLHANLRLGCEQRRPRLHCVLSVCPTCSKGARGLTSATTRPRNWQWRPVPSGPQGATSPPTPPLSPSHLLGAPPNGAPVFKPVLVCVLGPKTC